LKNRVRWQSERACAILSCERPHTVSDAAGRRR
jgi:hypothetical protein